MTRTVNSVAATFLLFLVLMPGKASGQSDTVATPVPTSGTGTGSAPEENKEEKEEKLRELAAALKAAEDLKEEEKEIFAGLSVGFRMILDSEESLWGKINTDPQTGELRKEYRDRKDVVVSAAIGYFPRVLAWGLTNFGFMAHLNLAEITGDIFALKSKAIEGGLGLGWMLSRSGWIGLTADRVFSRRINPALGNGPYKDATTDKIIYTYDVNNDLYFFTDKLFAMTIHVVWRL